jgi:outer membrane immunogenic protein
MHFPGAARMLSFIDMSWGTSTMRRIVLAIFAAALSLCATEIASAQDILRMIRSPVPVATWTGFYVGGNVGYGWAKDNSTATSSVPGTAASTFTMKGMIAGGQIGVNVQFSGPWVIGIESDFQGSWQKLNGPGNTTNLNISAGFAAPQNETTSIDWFGTTRARFGVADNQFLVYGTIGLAYAAVRTQASSAGLTIIKDSPVKIGWAAGGGIEVMLSRNWFLRGEYLHLDFGGSTDAYTTAGGAITADLHQRITDDIVRFGVNYMFR